MMKINKRDKAPFYLSSYCKNMNHIGCDAIRQGLLVLSKFKTFENDKIYIILSKDTPNCECYCHEDT